MEAACGGGDERLPVAVVMEAACGGGDGGCLWRYQWRLPVVWRWRLAVAWRWGLAVAVAMEAGCGCGVATEVLSLEHRGTPKPFALNVKIISMYDVIQQTCLDLYMISKKEKYEASDSNSNK